MIDKEIIKIASNTENHGVLDNHTHFSKLKNSICGDVMRIYLIVKDSLVLDRFFEIVFANFLARKRWRSRLRASMKKMSGETGTLWYTRTFPVASGILLID